MNSFIVFGIMFIPLYIFYNFRCLKRRKVSFWLNEKLETIEDSFFSFQFKSSVIIGLVMTLLITIATISRLNESSLPLIVIVFFNLSIYISKCVAIKKGYAIKINKSNE